MLLKNFYISGMILLFLAMVAGCKKKDGDNVNLDPNKQQWYDFMSSKNGSFWRYASDQGTFWTRYAREMDTMMLGKKYRYYERKDDSSGGYDPEFFGKNNSFYLTLINLDVNGNGSYVDYVYYKDSAKVTDAFTNTGEISSPLGNINVVIESYVESDNNTYLCGNTTFTNVLHVHSNIKGNAGIFQNVGLGTLDIWFKKGLGVMKEKADINVLGQYKQNYFDSLVDYHIEP